MVILKQLIVKAMVLHSFVLFILCFVSSTSAQVLVPTLAGGATGSGSGNLLINGFAVCDKGWDDNAATVACRWLNTWLNTSYTSGKATIGSSFGNVSPNFIFTDVSCSGEESSLLDCEGVCEPSCGPGEAAGARCQEFTSTLPSTTTSTTTA